MVAGKHSTETAAVTDSSDALYGLSAHFRAKVDGIRAATAGSMDPDISTCVVPRLSDFTPVTAQEIADLLRKAPAKHCDQDPVSTWLVKKASAVFSPLLSRMCNASLSAGVLPVSQKHATVRPLLKKATLDPDVLSSYRPISNLTFTSKLVYRVVAARFMQHKLLPERQSAYRRFHLTETAIVAMLATLAKPRKFCLRLVQLQASGGTPADEIGGAVVQATTDVVDTKLCTIMHSVHHGMRPAYFADTVSAIADNPTRPGLRSADSTSYRLPKCRTCTSMGQRLSGPLA